MISIVDILSALSDDKAFIIFNTIALGGRHDSRTLIKNTGITPHQYYSKLLKITSRTGQKSRRQVCDYSTGECGL